MPSPAGATGGVALHDVAEDAQVRGASWSGVDWALNTSRQSAYERSAD